MHIHFYGKWLGDIKAIYNILIKENEYIITKDFQSFTNQDKPNKADFIITSDQSCPYCSGKEIHVGHGIGCISKIYHKSKNDFVNDYCNRYYAITVHGKYEKKLYASMGFPEDKILIIGSPTSYELMQEYNNKKEFLNSLGLDSKLKTILYAPTWNQDSKRGFFPIWENDERYYIDKLCCFIKYNLNANFLIRMHESFRYSKDWRLIYSDIFNKYSIPYIYMNEYPDGVDFFKHSDVLLGDMSSANTYFYILDKPVVHIGSDIMLSKRNKGIGGWDIGDRAGYISDNFSEILAYIKDSLENPLSFSTERKKVISKYIDYVGIDSKDQLIKELECLSHQK